MKRKKVTRRVKENDLKYIKPAGKDRKPSYEYSLEYQRWLERARREG